MFLFVRDVKQRKEHLSLKSCKKKLHAGNALENHLDQ